eukprot:9581043-Alexandrium_andersonii.AAC.1
MEDFVVMSQNCTSLHTHMDKVFGAPAHAVILQEVRALPAQCKGLQSKLSFGGLDSVFGQGCKHQVQQVPESSGHRAYSKQAGAAAPGGVAIVARKPAS